MSTAPSLEQISHQLTQVARQLGDVAMAVRPDDPRRIYSLEEVAELTGWALDTLKEDCRTGRLKYVRKGRAYGLTARQLDDAIEQHTENGDVQRRLASVVTSGSGVKAGNRRNAGRRAA
ncbi:MAG TPA: hypothetical protein VI172_08420 [Candidatus Dormibacteraeota bacterium]|jgi:hypothetical protein